jgi:dipeptidyl aminopeptidase/acylaminoacyl peptidase
MKKLTLLSLLMAARLGAQDAGPPSDENALAGHINYNPTNQKEQLALLIQEVYKVRAEVVASNFRQEYGDHVAMRRLLYPANTQGHEAIPAYLFTPRHAPAGKKLPALILLHGGDHTQLSEDFFPWIAEAVERGYIVLFPEYRGSSGYGDAIYENDYGFTDFADVMAATDYLAGLETVDPGRLGIIGHSRGGMLALRELEVEPKRFAAGVDLAALSDMVAFMGYKEQARREDIASQKHFGGKMPGRNLAPYLEISPALHVEKIEAPLLVLSTTHDTNVPYELGNKRVVEALKAYGKVFENHVYEAAPGSHGFPFVDGPDGRDCHRRVWEFLAKYLHPQA